MSVDVTTTAARIKALGDYWIKQTYDTAPGAEKVPSMLDEPIAEAFGSGNPSDIHALLANGFRDPTTIASAIAKLEDTEATTLRELVGYLFEVAGDVRASASAALAKDLKTEPNLISRAIPRKQSESTGLNPLAINKELMYAVKTSTRDAQDKIMLRKRDIQTSEARLDAEPAEKESDNKKARLCED